MRPCAALLFLLLPALVGQEPPDPLSTRLRALGEHLARRPAPPDALELLEQAAIERLPDLADQALALCFPEFKAALELAGRGEASGPVELARLAENAPEDIIRLHSLYHLGRFCLDSGDPEGASRALSAFFAGKSALSPREAEAAFFYGVALSRIPSREEALNVLSNFLKAYPWAPERYRVQAFQMVEELKRPEANPLHEIADEMRSVERKLKSGDPGQKTIDQERRILDRLDELIEKLEEQERNRKGGGGPGGGNQPPSSPAQSAKPPEGEARIGELNQGARRLAARWGELRDKEREEVLQELEKRFPPRYRALLEAYFKKLSRSR